MKSLVVCVEFDDFLNVTLPRNVRHFERTMVVTSVADTATQKIALDLGCELFITDAFYENGTPFNKGLAVERAFDAFGRDGWICIWDADIVMPQRIEFEKDESCLYTALRRTLVSASEFDDDLDWSTIPVTGLESEFPGYFQLFHARVAGAPPWYSTHWIHAGGCDSDFQSRFPAEHRKHPAFNVLHLGPTIDTVAGGMSARVGENWCGRVTSRIDSSPQQFSEYACRKNAVQQIKSNRQGNTTVTEHVAGVDRIPKRISFFWVGRMSWLRWLTLASFVRMNPGWEVFLYAAASELLLQKHWNGSPGDDNSYTGPDYFHALPPSVQVRQFNPPGLLAPAQMCDVFQWNLLASEGGFYADLDILWLKPMDTVFAKLLGYDAIFCLEAGLFAIGFMASCPGCPVFGKLRDSITVQPNDDYQFYGTNLVHRVFGINAVVPGSGDEVIRRCGAQYPSLRLTKVPDHIVYPFDWRETAKIFRESHPVNEDAIGLHWFGGCPCADEFSNAMTGENWRNYDNTVTRCLKAISWQP
ncbi:MAG: hypothetical protein ABIH23_00835 [bacterium]